MGNTGSFSSWQFGAFLQRLYWRSGGIGTMVSLASKNSQSGTMDCSRDDCVGAWTISRHTSILRGHRKLVVCSGPAGRGLAALSLPPSQESHCSCCCDGRHPHREAGSTLRCVSIRFDREGRLTGVTLIKVSIRSDREGPPHSFALTICHPTSCRCRRRSGCLSSGFRSGNAACVRRPDRCD